MRESTPRVSVVIPTRNRKEMLRDVLASVRKQTVPVEIWVMDDASTDGTGDLVAEEFPEAHYRRSEIAKGPTFQRNSAVGEVLGQYVVTLDDDCVLQSPHTLAQTVRLFDRPRIGAVTIPFVNVRHDNVVRTAAPICATEPYLLLEYYGGMVAFDTATYRAVRGYRPEYFMYVEEQDLAIRMLMAGFAIRAGTADPVHHQESQIRNVRRIAFYGVRNSMLFAWLNVPLPYLVIYLPATSIRSIYHGFRNGRLWAAISGFFAGAGVCLRYWGQRRPASTEVYLMSRRMRREGMVRWGEVERALRWGGGLPR